MLYQAIQDLELQPDLVPTTAHLQSATVQALVEEKFHANYQPEQLQIEGVGQQSNVEAVVAKIIDLVLEKQSIFRALWSFPKEQLKLGSTPLA